MYPQKVIQLGEDMKFDTFGNTTKEPFIEGFTEPSIFLNSDRIVLFDEEQGHDYFFANNNVHIKGKSVQIRNPEVVDVNSNNLFKM